jgi:hypothetical protein
MPTARKIRSITEIQPGCIVRQGTDVLQGEIFTDCIVLGAEREYGNATGECFKVARPYAFVTGTGTQCPTLLLGSENLVVSFENLERYYLIVVDKNDVPRTYTT